MPRIWADTLASHRQQVTGAILDAMAELVAEHGPVSVAMSSIAERAGIGRATLYKYFPDVGSILVAWHARDFAEHAGQLRALSTSDDVTLDDVAQFICKLRERHGRGGAGVIGVLAHTLAGAEGHHGGTIEHEIIAVLTRLLTRLVEREEVRDDQDPEFLARWLFHAGHAPAELDDQAVSQLVADSLAPRPAGV
ncbi:MAG: TetR/AcrR family transcriptional regulator [Acidimicrobiia bacterium]|nr:TetR/AcrR family transcriptional regulator [Acidimicrobiia bacterium]